MPASLTFLGIILILGFVTYRTNRFPGIPSAPHTKHVRDAEKRWAETNARARKNPCKCGAPATHVRSLPYVVGNVPYEIYTCADHINVNAWSSDDGITWTPSDDTADSFDAPEMQPWAGTVNRV